MHRGEATTSQLGRHPDEPPFSTVNLKILLKKVKKIQEGD